MAEKFSKWIGNVVRKGEIARDETCTADTYKPGLVREKVQREYITHDDMSVATYKTGKEN